MRNKLAIAVANIEAFIDGKLEPTPARLDAVLSALYSVDLLIDEVKAAPQPAPNFAGKGFIARNGNDEGSA